jgi:branched-chain amino acid transport system permease protein
MDRLQLFAQFVYDGVAIGAVYGLIAVGITVVYGLSRIIHFAVGELTMMGAFIAWDVQGRTGSFGLAFGAAVLGMAVVGLATERTMFRLTIDTPLAGFIVSLGLIIFLQALAVELWGADTRSVRPPLKGVFSLGSVIFRKQTLMNTGIAVLALAVFYIALDRTQFGKSLRALADDQEAAALMGVPVQRTIMLTFAVGAVLTGVSGWIILTIGSISPLVGSAYVLRGFVVALIGGLGNVRGAAVAGLGLGIAESLAIGYGQPSWSEFYVFLIVIVVLVWRPTGLARGAEGAHL